MVIAKGREQPAVLQALTVPAMALTRGRRHINHGSHGNDPFPLGPYALSRIIP
jgi:hypothetical protein